MLYKEEWDSDTHHSKDMDTHVSSTGLSTATTTRIAMSSTTTRLSCVPWLMNPCCIYRYTCVISARVVDGVHWLVHWLWCALAGKSAVALLWSLMRVSRYDLTHGFQCPHSEHFLHLYSAKQDNTWLTNHEAHRVTHPNALPRLNAPQSEKLVVKLVERMKKADVFSLTFECGIASLGALLDPENPEFDVSARMLYQLVKERTDWATFALAVKNVASSPFKRCW
jgi:hypothetical protein